MRGFEDGVTRMILKVVISAEGSRTPNKNRVATFILSIVREAFKVPKTALYVSSAPAIIMTSTSEKFQDLLEHFGVVWMLCRDITYVGGE
ncbi:MAG: hypothetical protein RMJ28_04105 [Nitrososphaerota archaeon]|nr:hypothetical protein [Nitrososphaerota archaeon]